MKAPKLEVLAPLRAAVVNDAAIAALHPAWSDTRAVFTRRPPPADAPYPMTIIGPVITRGDADGVNDFRPSLVVDVSTYGTQGPPGDPVDQLRTVEDIAELIYGLFHRQRRAITVVNYGVTDIRCTGPSPAPADDDQHVARRVTLTIRLYATKEN